jgi:23S rRNA pseudouridine2605 synthase
VEVDGKPIPLQTRPRWILLHKPAGTLTTRSDARRRRTVYDLLPPEVQGLRYVGRLDRNTEGLLLLTNQGDVANALLHPSGEVEREYHAGVTGVPDAPVLRQLTRGVDLEDGPARAASARLLRREREGGVLSLVLLEGRKREVRHLLEAVGYPVRWLRRVRFGPQTLGTLALGSWRDLTPEEVRHLTAATRRSAAATPRRAPR